MPILMKLPDDTENTKLEPTDGVAVHGLPAENVTVPLAKDGIVLEIGGMV
jgi:hypothetical protein